MLKDPKTHSNLDQSPSKAMGQNSGNFAANLPILDGKNWNRWRVQMKALMGYQDVNEIVEHGFQTLVEGATQEQRKLYKENTKKDCKAMFLLHQCIDEAHFEKIYGAENSKETWLILEACNQGVEQLKKVRFQTLRRQYELMQMETNERVAQFFNKIVIHINAMKTHGEKIIVIEESKKVEDMKVEDLQGSLEAHEQRLIERSTEKHIDQALQAHFIDKRSFGGRNRFRGRGGRKEFRSGNHKNFQHMDQDRIDHDRPKNSARRGSLNHWKGGRKLIDIKKVGCFNYIRANHFSNECKAPLSQSDGRGKQHSVTHIVREELEAEINDQTVLLMMITNQVSKNKGIWYIDSRCSSHMTGHKDWLVNFDEKKKSNVIFF
ncbi:PREDICTED: uncharacterized protein LOC109359925 [Lupinus angustifolius]|uniref:uncharacterized protein LOC109359925 n=1 Tax=Lupinus angustifolius TaxID=3871 RepID=UPI00092E3E42|nr:PREDICTED: uncharacterized protein LOC109359925 [Lupinus angustifolius]